MVCVSVNDGWTMRVWGDSLRVPAELRMLGDGDAEFARAIGLDFAAKGMGTRCKRFSMLVESGVVRAFNVEQPGQYGITGAEAMLEQVKATSKI